LHRLAKEYPKYTPADYVLSDNPDMPLIFEINQACAETGWLVEHYLNEQIEVEENEINKRGKMEKVTKRLPKYTLAEILDPAFDPDAYVSPERKRAKDARELMVPEHDEIDPDDME
jgi:hypothetical protein